MNLRKDIFAIGAFLAVVVAVWVGASMMPAPKIVEFSGEGVCDLSGADFAGAVYVPNGYWTSYPEALYSPQDAANLGGSASAVPSGSLDYTKVQYATAEPVQGARLRHVHAHDGLCHAPLHQWQGG